VRRARMKKGTGERGKTGQQPTAFESARGGAVERRRGRQGGRAMHGEHEKRGPSSNRRGTVRATRQRAAAVHAGGAACAHSMASSTHHFWYTRTFKYQ
jgi:hypothetical protein